MTQSFLIFNLERQLPLRKYGNNLQKMQDQIPTSGTFQWLTPLDGLAAQVQQLKRSYWPWQWQYDEEYCFFPPAEAFLGEYGRAGTFTQTVGVLQPTGRPFGDLKKACNTTERLMIIHQGIQGGSKGAKEMRDLGILSCHLGKFQTALELMTSYDEWLAKTDQATLGNPHERDVVKSVVVKLQQLLLEQTYKKELIREA
eukprot:TRINITY_DN14470_c0_g1_i3.p2 TRINITY_DN14470_c0_g1~~TRINITY_DN14470_c0_g1_i3.p2  ORF type:complete len:199 (-),score=10.90 TRINITY_DN14470_c0_g1_i3:149-745(-)